ncbi:MAG: PhzF family phenazine biosynthesis protein [Oscillatoriales cyanobacterium SM2_2_1]|nr:PhzF family phenazine biosynthesis protein [Oscillatoriales cyanobacterium SM2_2_1]
MFEFAIIDAFSDRPFTGNPAATLVLEAFPDSSLMQAIAAEMNLSETAFAVPLAPNHYHLRWFTPRQEVPLCGHATLAMAHYLRERSLVDVQQPLSFDTQRQRLTVFFTPAGITLDFPAHFPHLITQTTEIVPGIHQGYKVGDYWLVELEHATAVQQFVPDLGAIAQLPTLGLIITARGDAHDPDSIDFVSRFFAPQAGIPEDPVTGSAHCGLAPYWQPRLQKQSFRARQCSPRQGLLTVTLRGDRVLITGQSITTAQGQLLIAPEPSTEGSD